MADDAKKINWGKIALGFGLTFTACLLATGAFAMVEHHLMGGKKVKLMPPTPPAAPAKPAA
jgi:hypothetical protein